MMRLIDADQVYADAYDSVHYRAEIEDFEFDAIINFIDRAPTVDAVPVVRCGECVHGESWRNSNGIDGFKCNLFCVDLSPEDFCSFGERKEGADNDQSETR